MKAIYKIENTINHKVYIGQSNDPNRRWEEHCRYKDNNISLIDRAINKYGKDNFTLEILGWYEDYNEKEKEYIALYRSLNPYGYNILKGGQDPPHYNGEKNPASKISQKTASKVIEQLQDWRIPRKTIVSNNKISQDILRHINEGDSWRQDNLIYPLRPTESTLNEYRAKYIQYMCCDSTIPLNQLGALVGWGRSSAKMINQGINHRDDRLKYPIRENKQYNKQFLNQETCIDYLHFGE